MGNHRMYNWCMRTFVLHPVMHIGDHIGSARWDFMEVESYDGDGEPKYVYMGPWWVDAVYRANKRFMENVLYKYGPRLLYED